MDTTKIMLRCGLIAKDIAPKETGNLAFNSIRTYKTPRGFRIVSLGNAAPYNTYLEYGTKRSKKHQKWWSEKVKLAVRTYLNSNLNGDREQYKRVAMASKNNKLREKRFFNSIPKE